MQIEFRTDELEQWFTDEAAAKRDLGKQIAKAYRKQIELLRAAPNQAELSRIPQLHFKAMAKGTPLAGKFSVRLSGFMRLVLSVAGQVVTVEEVSKHYDE
jgi:plasmid maintenance system killer protein